MLTIKIRSDGLVTEVEVLPCPFCGNDPVCSGLPRGFMGQIVCRNDDCFGPKTTAMTKKDSVAQWNKRPPQTIG